MSGPERERTRRCPTGVASPAGRPRRGTRASVASTSLTDVLALLAGFGLGALLLMAVLRLTRGPRPAVAGPRTAPNAPHQAPPSAPPAAAPRVDHPIRVNHPGARPAAASASPPRTAGPVQARLDLEDGSGGFDLGDETVTLGRGTDQRLRIPDSRASRAHAVIRPRSKGGWELKDNGSANGTKLNGHTIPEARVAPLRDGDRIGIGPVTIIYTEKPAGPAPGTGPAPDADATRVN